MTPESKRRPHGRRIRCAGSYWAYMPKPLPPRIAWSAELTSTLSAADRSVGQLAGEGRRLANPHRLIRPFIRREAVFSSRIEGTEATLGELLAAEAGAVVERSPADVREVANYVVALEYGVKRLGSLPLSLRLVRELHEELGVTAPFKTSQSPGRLVDRSRRDGIQPTSQGVRRCRPDGLIRRQAGFCGPDSRVEHLQRGRCARSVQHRLAHLEHAPICRGLESNLGADPGRVTHGQTDTRQGHDATSGSLRSLRHSRSPCHSHLLGHSSSRSHNRRTVRPPRLGARIGGSTSDGHTTRRAVTD